MKKMSWKAGTALLMALTMTMSLTACFGGNGNQGSGTSGGNSAANSTVKDYVYRESGNIEVDLEYIDNLSVVGERIYATSTFYGENNSDIEYSEDSDSSINPEDITSDTMELQGEETEEGTATETEDGTATENEDGVTAEDGTETTAGGSYITVLSFDLDGGNQNSIQIPFDVDSYPSRTCIDEQGNVYLIISKSEPDPSDPEGYSYNETYFIEKYSAIGEQIFRQEIDTADLDYFYVTGVVATKDGKLIISSENQIYVYDEQGNNVGKMDGLMDTYIDNLVALDNGKIFISYWKNDESGSEELCELDLETMKFGTTYEKDRNIMGGLMPGKGYDFYINDGSKISGYNIATKELVTIMNFIDSDVDYNFYGTFTPITETKMVAIKFDPDNWEPTIVFFDKVDPKDIADKEIITVGCVYSDYEVSTKLINYNKSSDQYRMRFIDYSQYNTDEDYSLAATQLNNDIISGNAPDIILLNYELPLQSYMQKGVLADLNEFLENDPEINKEDLMTNVVNMGSYDGKLCFLAPSFYLNTLATKASNVSGKTSWTLDDVKALEAQKGTSAFYEYTQDSLLYSAFSMSYDNFLDLETGKCNFDSDEFVALLEYIATYPKEINYDDYDENDYSAYETMYREDKALTQFTGVNSFRDFNYLEKGTFGEEVALVGFPGAVGNGASISFDKQFAISSKSEYQQEAWNFIRDFFTEDYQKSITYGWPVNRKVIDKLAEEAKEKPYYEDEDGSKVEYDETYYIGGIEVPITQIDDARIAYVKTYIESIDKQSYYDDSLINIITEEAAPFFAGQKTAKEAAAIIQSRAQIYVNEKQ